MVRLLGLLLLLGIGWLIVRQLLGPSRRRPDPPPPQFQKTVQCERCGVHMPLSLARRDGDDRTVCGEPECEKRRAAGADRRR